MSNDINGQVVGEKTLQMIDPMDEKFVQGAQPFDKLNADEAAALRESIQKNGFTVPILLCSDGFTVIAGNQRLAQVRVINTQAEDAGKPYPFPLIPAFVLDVDASDTAACMVAASQFNTAGRQYTNKAKRAAVEKVFTAFKMTDKDLPSNVAIGKMTGTSHPFVGQIRTQMDLSKDETDTVVWEKSEDGGKVVKVSVDGEPVTAPKKRTVSLKTCFKNLLEVNVEEFTPEMTEELDSVIEFLKANRKRKPAGRKPTEAPTEQVAADPESEEE